MRKINIETFKPAVVAAETGDKPSMKLVADTLRPTIDDSAEQIAEKIKYFIKIIYHSSLKFEDAPFHRDIDFKFAEQIESLLKNGTPKYKIMLFIGFRESAKTTRVKMCQAYINLYLEDLIDYANVVSADGAGAIQFTMDMFNMFAYSKIDRYFPDTISKEFSKGKKESQTMSKFTTTSGVTYAATSAIKTKRGGAQVNIDETGEIEVKRPKQLILDDIENENTIKSLVITQSIRDVMNASIDGLDQVIGFTVCTANYLSLRGNIHYLITKHRDDPEACIVMIPIEDGEGNPTWPGKYVKTVEQQMALQREGIAKVAIETIRSKADNFDVEFLNNPSRSLVYFNNEVLARVDEDSLVNENRRDTDGLLTIETPTKHDKYLIGVDTALGLGKDQSTFVVWKRTGTVFEEVANFRNNRMPPEEFAPFTVNIAEQYNHADIVPERNFPGNEFIARVIDIYNNVFSDDDEKYGIHTNLKSKPEMFRKFKIGILDRYIKIRSSALYHQLMDLPSGELQTVNNNRDDSGGHFDLLMSAVVGLFKADAAAEISDGKMQAAAVRVARQVFGDD